MALRAFDLLSLEAAAITLEALRALSATLPMYAAMSVMTFRGVLPCL